VLELDQVTEDGLELVGDPGVAQHHRGSGAVRAELVHRAQSRFADGRVGVERQVVLGVEVDADAAAADVVGDGGVATGGFLQHSRALPGLGPASGLHPAVVLLGPVDQVAAGRAEEVVGVLVERVRLVGVGGGLPHLLELRPDRRQLRRQELQERQQVGLVDAGEPVPRDGGRPVAHHLGDLAGRHGQLDGLAPQHGAGTGVGERLPRVPAAQLRGDPPGRAEDDLDQLAVFSVGHGVPHAVVWAKGFC